MLTDKQWKHCNALVHRICTNKQHHWRKDNVQVFSTAAASGMMQLQYCVWPKSLGLNQGNYWRLRIHIWSRAVIEEGLLLTKLISYVNQKKECPIGHLFRRQDIGLLKLSWPFYGLLLASQPSSKLGRQRLTLQIKFGGFTFSLSQPKWTGWLYESICMCFRMHIAQPHFTLKRCSLPEIVVPAMVKLFRVRASCGIP